MKIISILIFSILFCTLTNNLFPQHNIISPEERRARIVEAYNRQMQMNENNIKADEDPLPDAMTQRFFTGQAAGDYFGWSVSNAGDVNSDGYDDIVIGAYNNDAGGSNAGRAYIYFGGNPMDYIADLIMTGEGVDNFMGTSVSTAGDVNGDGYSDVIIGANGNDEGAANGGKVYIFYGGANMDNVADVNIVGTVAGIFLGTDVATAGDVNGDGYSDVIAASYTYNSYTGIAYIYFGGPAMDTTPDVTMMGETNGNYFGSSISSVGDVNGDGYSDVIIGAYGNDGSTGRAYIYFGDSAMDDIADLIMNGENTDDLFGSSVSGAGDVNSDGYSDVIVGAVANDVAGYNSGRAYIFLGESTFDNFPDVVIDGNQTTEVFGSSVSSAGDINGDGYSDVIIGAVYNDAGGTDAGRAYIYFGSDIMDNIEDMVMTGEAAGDQFGISVSLAGDIDGDGYTDIIVGAHLNDFGGTDAGRVYLYLNSLTGPDIPDEFFTGENAVDFFGHSVSDAGDLNGDGYADIIVGAYGYNSSTGRAYIYYGGPLLDNVADVIMTGEGTSNLFGSSVSSAGDVNKDGFDDVIVGAYGSDFNGPGAGTAYLYYGGSIMDGLPDLFIDGSAGEFLGLSASNAGDVNGDGYADIIVGASGFSSSQGRAYIYYGGTVMNNVADVIMTGAGAGYEFGYTVSNAGDVNGDGYSDVIASARNYSTNTGRVYIYYGGSSMDNSADVIMSGEGAGHYFGLTTATAGDVNADGYSDVIVGAEGFSAMTGRVYIYFGGASMNNVADLVMTGSESNLHFGSSVSTAGDVNADGYSDVIVGAEYYNAFRGQSYVYYGGTSIDGVADIIMTGTQGDYLGGSVSTAGDVNGDNYSDLVLGSKFNDAGGNDAGRAYLYLSSSPPIKPRIMSVKDVPFDQGGQVRLKWVRSGYDVQGISKITDYLIQRSFPPDENGFSWENLASMPASNEPFYSYVAETPNDSMTNNSGTYYFRITARTSNPNEYWRSNILYGHSVDNLAPLPPGAFYAQLNGSDVHLGWQANLESDLRDYYIYRSDTPVLVDLTLLGTTTDTTFNDTSPLPGNAYYYVQAFDIHNNGSEMSVDSIRALLSANVKVFLQGPYALGSMNTTLNTNGYIPLSQPYNTTPWNYNGTESVASIPSEVVDWVLLELRSDLITPIIRRAAFVLSNGNLVDLDGVSFVDFPSVPEGNYYLVIYHRNHLQIMTSNPVELSASPSLYDLTTGATQAYGTDPMKDLGNGNFGMYSGDTNNSGIVNAADKSLVNSFNLNVGYYSADTNFSGIVTAGDKSNINSNNLKQKYVP